MTTVLPTLHATSRVWQYVSDRPLSGQEVEAITNAAKTFCANWTAHNNQLRADAFVLHNQVLVLAVDESTAGASGCSIDKSTHFVERVGADLGIDLFVRDRVFYQQPDGEVVIAKLALLPELAQNGQLTPETLVFDTLAATLGQLTEQGWKPLANSWQKRWV